MPNDLARRLRANPSIVDKGVRQPRRSRPSSPSRPSGPCSSILAMLRIVSICVSVLVSAAVAIAQPRQSVRSPRLYVFDCGTLDVADTGRFRLKREEVATDKLSVGCYLVAH